MSKHSKGPIIHRATIAALGLSAALLTTANAPLRGEDWKSTIQLDPLSGAGSKGWPWKATVGKRVQREDLRYAGKGFEEWRAVLLTELQPKIRLLALRTLMRFGTHGYGAEATAAFLEVGRGFDSFVRDRFERELKGEDEAKAELFKEDGGPGEGELIEACVEAAAWLGPTAVPVLRTGLKDETFTVRWMATMALGNMKGKARSAVPDLVEFVRGDDLVLKASAIEALGKIGIRDKHTCGVVLDCLDDSETGVRRAAIDALANLDRRLVPFAAPAILAALKDDDSSVRSKAMETISKTNLGKEAVPAYLCALDDADAGVQQAAYGQLQGLGAEARSAVPALLIKLKEMVSERSGKPTRKIAVSERVPARKIAESELVQKSGHYCCAPAMQAYDESADVIATLGAIGPEAKEALPVLQALAAKADDKRKELIQDAAKKIKPVP